MSTDSQESLSAGEQAEQRRSPSRTRRPGPQPRAKAAPGLPHALLRHLTPISRAHLPRLTQPRLAPPLVHKLQARKTQHAPATRRRERRMAPRW